MPRKDRPKRRKLRDLSATKAHKNGGTNTNGMPRGGVIPAFRSGGTDPRYGYPILLTRQGKRVDLRTHAGRRYVTLIADIVADLGGAENLSTMQHLLVHRVAAIALDLEYQEAEALSENKALDPHIHRTQANTLKNLLTTLGLRRKARDISPKLKDIIDGTVSEASYG